MREVLDEKYKKNEYYYTRFMFLKAYNIVENSYEGNDKNVTNKFNENVKDVTKKLEKQKILELYESTLSALPIFQPYNVHKVLYESLKKFSEPFEAEYKSAEVKCEYRIAKLFRNWSLHYKFEENEEMKQEYFLFLFLLECMQYIANEKEGLENVLLENILKEVIEKLNFQVSCAINPGKLKKVKEILSKELTEAEDKRLEQEGDVIKFFGELGREKEKKVSYKYLWGGYMDGIVKRKTESSETELVKDFFEYACYLLGVNKKNDPE